MLHISLVTALRVGQCLMDIDNVGSKSYYGPDEIVESLSENVMMNVLYATAVIILKRLSEKSQARKQPGTKEPGIQAGSNSVFIFIFLTFLVARLLIYP